MKLGLALPTFGPDARPEGILRVCRTAKEMGYDSLWTGDRVLAPRVPTAPYPSSCGEMPRAYENHMDPLVAPTFAAAHSTQVAETVHGRPVGPRGPYKSRSRPCGVRTSTGFGDTRVIVRDM